MSGVGGPLNNRRSIGGRHDLDWDAIALAGDPGAMPVAGRHELPRIDRRLDAAGDYATRGAGSGQARDDGPLGRLRRDGAL